MFDILVSAAVEAATNDSDRQWEASRPDRGGAGRYLDSNVRAVWDDVPTWIRSLALCVARHESLHSGHYVAENPTSTAAGRYQFLSSTWQGNAKWAKVDGKFVARQYATASAAPAWVQDAVFVHSIQNGGIKAWRGTGCAGTE
jgi:hypothetical protein